MVFRGLKKAWRVAKGIYRNGRVAASMFRGGRKLYRKYKGRSSNRLLRGSFTGGDNRSFKFTFNLPKVSWTGLNTTSSASFNEIPLVHIWSALSAGVGTPVGAIASMY